MIFSTNQINVLQDYNFKERQQIIAIAMQKITVPQKLILNLIKLSMLIPPFIFIASMKGLELIICTSVVLITYFIVLRPIMLSFSLKHLEHSISQFNKKE